MTPLAAIRDDDVNLPLFLHVLGAMLLVGTLLAVALMLFAAWRRGDEDGGTLRRYAFRTLLLGTLPSYILMRVGAEWVRSEEFGAAPEPGWIGVGYITSDGGAVLLLISLIVGGIAARRARTRGPDGGRVGARVVAVLVSLMLIAYVVAVWAMTAKP